MRKTKIICTLGPKTNELDMVKKILLAGIDGIRMNFSHGDHKSHTKMLDTIRKATKELGIQVPLILDTKGPEIRTGVMKDNKEVRLNVGSSFTLTTEDVVGDETRVSVSYKNLPFDVKRGSVILIDDGLIALRVKNINNTEVECEVENGGMIGSRKGINIPDIFVNLPALTSQDIEDIKFGIQAGFDYIAASFIRTANDVIQIRHLLETNGGQDIQIIAKIENRDGVNNINEILEVADGIMVARGDLGVEIPPEEVPIVQKLLVKKANAMGKPVITATQMLESMITNPRPTRAEASDVANAIFDGTSAVMLSGETAKGEYPLEAIKMMARIARKAEEAVMFYNLSLDNTGSKLTMTNGISHATNTTAQDLGATCIVTVTKSGYTARELSKFKPSVPIIACTRSDRVARQLRLVWGCIPIRMDYTDQTSTDEVLQNAVDKAEEMKFVKQGDVVVLTAGIPVGVAGTTNILKVQYVGDVLGKGIGIGKERITGKACVVKVPEEAERFFRNGDILVTRKTDNSYLPYMRKASAIVVEDATVEETNHAAIVARALEIPIIIGSKNIVEVVKNNTIITVDSENGCVYNGTV